MIFDLADGDEAPILEYLADQQSDVDFSIKLPSALEYIGLENSSSVLWPWCIVALCTAAFRLQDCTQVVAALFARRPDLTRPELWWNANDRCAAIGNITLFLHLATRVNNPRLFKALMKHGCEVTIRDLFAIENLHPTYFIVAPVVHSRPAMFEEFAIATVSATVGRKRHEMRVGTWMILRAFTDGMFYTTWISYIVLCARKIRPEEQETLASDIWNVPAEFFMSENVCEESQTSFLEKICVAFEWDCSRLPFKRMFSLLLFGLRGNERAREVLMSVSVPVDLLLQHGATVFLFEEWRAMVCKEIKQ